MAFNGHPIRLIEPHGGVLVNRLAHANEALRERAAAAQRITLSEVSLSDLELIATGVLSPLTGFMDSTTYRAVVHNMHTTSGLPWTIPVTLPVDADTAAKLHIGKDVALADADGKVIGLLELAEKFPYDKTVEAEKVYRTTDMKHPGVERLMGQGEICLAGEVWLLELPQPSFPDIYHTPAQTRALFAERGWRRIAAFQTRNPIHRAHEYLQKCALEMADGLMLHPLVGETKSDDLPAAVRVESYRVIIDKYYPPNRVLFCSFPAAMRYAGRVRRFSTPSRAKITAARILSSGATMPGWAITTARMTRRRFLTSSTRRRLGLHRCCSNTLFTAERAARS
jgi:sulfate adenylyltransferase